MKKSTRIGILLVVVTLLGLSAGLAMGLLGARVPGAGTSTQPLTGQRSPLFEELQLTVEQRDQMREIWETARGKVHRNYEDAQLLQKHRDDALVALLNDEQKAKFEKIAKDYADRYEAIKAKRKETFADAVERTKRLLNESQRQKYEEILKSQVGPDELGPGPGGLPH